MQFLFNCYPLKDNLLVSESGLTNGSNIMIINSGNIRGAGDNNENNNLTKDDSEDKICLTFQRVDGYRISFFHSFSPDFSTNSPLILFLLSTVSEVVPVPSFVVPSVHFVTILVL